MYAAKSRHCASVLQRAPQELLGELSGSFRGAFGGVLSTMVTCSLVASVLACKVESAPLHLLQQ